MQRKRLGEILVSEGLLSESQLNEALSSQKEQGLKLGELLERSGLVSEDKIIEAVTRQLGIPFVDLEKQYIDEQALSGFSEDLCRRHQVMPVSIVGGKIVVAMLDPLNHFALEEIWRHVGLKVSPAMTSRLKLENAFKKHYGKSIAEKAAGEYVSLRASKEDKKEDLKEDASAPVVKFMNTVIETAIRNKASDIHIEPEENSLRVRCRVDGLLQEMMRADISMNAAAVSRIKIMCNLDITKTRMPQDGRTHLHVDGRKIDLRVSTLPTTNGEKVVIRILDKTSYSLSKESLGLSEREVGAFNSMISKPHGLLLVTGPTGSGKTTTLYSILSSLDSERKNIVTIEDPVEYNFKNINQVQANENTGMTFANGLRSILRQDPDVVMIGEIRDSETAGIALRAALTGHLVLSTLHTNDAVSSVSRLVDMGVEPFLISATMVGVVAQRLVRRICPSCKKGRLANGRDRKLLGLNQDGETFVFSGVGCNLCNGSGYRGRIAVFEVLEMDHDYKKAIEEGQGPSEMTLIAEKKQLQTLKKNCALKVLEGVTTIEEFLRVAYS